MRSVVGTRDDSVGDRGPRFMTVRGTFGALERPSYLD